jgi:hypothetical protein
VSSNDLTTITRGAYGTATHWNFKLDSAHSDATIVYDATRLDTQWGEAVNASSVTLEPGLLVIK